LYFRAKALYAATFAAPPPGAPGLLVITPADGLREPLAPIEADTLRRYAGVRIDLREERYRRPLERDTKALAEQIEPAACKIVLLGSVATEKYAGVLRSFFGPRLVFPLDFVGRGDMSRGGLLLRCVDARRELEYVPIDSVVRHGARPPKLE
jgi:hypothetical protein